MQKSIVAHHATLLDVVDQLFKGIGRVTQVCGGGSRSGELWVMAEGIAVCVCGPRHPEPRGSRHSGAQSSSIIRSAALSRSCLIFFVRLRSCEAFFETRISENLGVGRRVL